MPFRPRALPRLAALLVASALGCGDAAAPDRAGPPARALAVSGGVFAGTVGARVAAPLALRVTDRDGRPVAGLRIEFAVSRGAGVALSPLSATTDPDGRAETVVELGVAAGEVEVTGTVAGLPSPVRFSGRAQAGPVARLAVSPRLLRLRVANDSALLRADAQDAYGNMAPGGAIAFASLDTTVMTVAPSGVVRARRTGASGRVVVTSGGHADTAVVSVADPALAPCVAARATVALAVGEIAAVPAAGGVCVRADDREEYTLVAVSSATSPASLTPLEITALGNATPSVLPALASRVGSATGEAALERDEATEQRFRAGEPATIARIATLPAIAAARAPVPQAAVGQLVQLNANAFQECRSPDLRTGRVVAVSQRAVVVADTANPRGGFSDDDYRRFGATFDTLVHPLAVAAFGEPQDLDGNGRAVIFFTRAVNELSPANSNAYVGGFFWVRDLNERSACAGSNAGEMFYMLVPDPEGLVTTANGSAARAFRHGFVDSVTVATLAHEYQHLINASRRALVTRTTVAEEGWLNEALSHVAEELVFHRRSGTAPRANLGGDRFESADYTAAFTQYAASNFGRLRSYLERPELYSPFADDGAGTGLQARGASWAFLRYLADQRAGGDGDAWFRLVNSATAGFANLQQVFGLDPLAAMRDWSVSLLTDDLLPGAATRYTQPSWNFRSAFAALPTGGMAYPLLTRALRVDGATGITLRAGGASYLRFAVPAGQEAMIQVGASGGTPPATVGTLLVRTR